MTEIDRIVRHIQQIFRTFGGTPTDPGNPIAVACQDRPVTFAAGVNVRDVVTFVVEEVRRRDQNRGRTTIG